VDSEEGDTHEDTGKIDVKSAGGIVIAHAVAIAIAFALSFFGQFKKYLSKRNSERLPIAFDEFEALEARKESSSNESSTSET
jgi:hypothetical protein